MNLGAANFLYFIQPVRDRLRDSLFGLSHNRLVGLAKFSLL